MFSKDQKQNTNSLTTLNNENVLQSIMKGKIDMTHKEIISNCPTLHNYKISLKLEPTNKKYKNKRKYKNYHIQSMNQKKSIIKRRSNPF